MKRQILDCPETEERKIGLQKKLLNLLSKKEEKNLSRFTGRCGEEHVVNTNPGISMHILPGEYFEKQLCYGCDSCPHEIAICMGIGKGCGSDSSIDVIWFLTENEDDPIYDTDISLGEKDEAPWAIKI